MRSIREKCSEYDLQGPFLISPSKKYENAPKKLFIIGQQTKGGDCYLDNVEKQMNAYEDFDLGRNYYNSPFWSIFHKIERAILDDEYCSAWGNFNRFDLKGDRPTRQIETEISTLDYLLQREIEILKPDICLFLIGHSFDTRIKMVFESASFNKIDGWDAHKLCRIKHTALPYYTYRTYHPRYLRCSRCEEPFIEFLKKEIKQS